MNIIADDVWQITGCPANYLNCYLLSDVLIDAATRWSTHRLLGQLRHRHLRLVALTHCHPDHQGAAQAICKSFGVPLACHRADVAAAEGRERMNPPYRIIRLGEWLWAGPGHPVGLELNDGDLVADFRVVHTPGHTPGHCMFFREADRLCIAGDVLANINFLTGKPGLRQPPAFLSSDPAQNRQSIQTLLELEPRTICFGHGPPLRDLRVLERYMARRRKRSIA
jgi:hydroxyacylglutathione hydrolase